MTKIKVGIVGYGALGQYLVEQILAHSDEFELAFVWNRTKERLRALPAALVLDDLAAFAERAADVIVEVSHPSITRSFGARFLRHAAFFAGSPTALGDVELERELREALGSGAHPLLVPSGALWGVHDIQKMAQSGKLAALTVTMKKHPGSFKLEGALKPRLAELETAGGAHVLFEGSVREVAPMAPNNVNTMAAAAMAAEGLGFDGTRARLVIDPALEAHVVVVEATATSGMTVRTERVNPAKPGAVTGSATYASFFSSLRATRHVLNRMGEIVFV